MWVTAFVWLLLNGAILWKHALLFWGIDLLSSSLHNNHRDIQVNGTGWRFMTEPVEDKSLLRAEGHNLLLTGTLLSDESSPTDAPVWWAQSRGLISSPLNLMERLWGQQLDLLSPYDLNTLTLTIESIYRTNCSLLVICSQVKKTDKGYANILTSSPMLDLRMAFHVFNYLEKCFSLCPIQQMKVTKPVREFK